MACPNEVSVHLHNRCFFSGGGGGPVSFKIQTCEIFGIVDVTYALKPVLKRFSCTYLASEKRNLGICKIQYISAFCALLPC